MTTNSNYKRVCYTRKFLRVMPCDVNFALDYVLFVLPWCENNYSWSQIKMSTRFVGVKNLMSHLLMCFRLILVVIFS